MEVDFCPVLCIPEVPVLQAFRGISHFVWSQPYRAQWPCGIPVTRGVAVGAGRDGLRAFYGQLHVLRDIFGRGADGHDQAYVCG